jgi:signal transduction histidine kinase
MSVDAARNTMTSMSIRVPRASPLFFDGILAVALIAVGLISLAEAGPGPTAEFSRSPDVWNVLLVVLMTAPVVMRRRYPVAVLTLVSLAWVVERLAEYPATLGIWSIPLALHAVGSEVEAKRSGRVAGAAIAGLVAFTALGAVTESVPWSTVILMAAFTIIPYILGREIHERRRRTAELEQRANEAEHRREQEARRAVRAERQRIARELHDIVAHDMTVMTVQASAARRLLRQDPERATTALEAVEAAGHEALQEMRRLLDVLRPQAADTARTPQPGLTRLDDLVRQMQDAGLEVEVAVEGEPAPLPAGVDLNVYRIIQESLTNALKHGGPRTKARVVLRYHASAMEVEVTDDGRGAAVGLAGNGSSGRGILGMRERAALLHGDIAVGPRPGGGYRVKTSIPLAAT